MATKKKTPRFTAKGLAVFDGKNKVVKCDSEEKAKAVAAERNKANK